MLDFVKSPLNYMGSKFEILGKIIPVFPKHIDKFVDLFTGGMNVAVNVDADTIYANDRITYLIEVYNYIMVTPTSTIFEDINFTIDRFKLSKTNADGYAELRDEYNKTKEPMLLLVLSFYAFNNVLRFNNSMEFNTSFGKTCFKSNAAKNLMDFSKLLKEKKYVLTSLDFRKFDFTDLTSDSLVYCDPPYSITLGSYSDGKRGFGGWSEQDDTDLLNILDTLNQKNVKFALSNVLKHGEKSNDLLIKWGSKYNVIHLGNYSNHWRYRSEGSENIGLDEVLITNF